MANVLVLHGGTSSEREVSLRSGACVQAALVSAGHTVTMYDPKDGIDELLDQALNYDVVFPALHGIGGEDGTLQALFEARSIPCVGSGSAASRLCFNKWQYKELLAQHGIQIPQGELVTVENIWQHPLLQRPFVLKPFDGGSSVDTFICRQPGSVDRSAIERALERNSRMLLEELIEGSETTVAILGDKPLPIIEIIPPQDEEFDYTNKYNGKTREICPPENISEPTQLKLQDIALRIHQLTGCQGMSRTDVMVAQDQQLYVLETNTIPGLTDQSLFPKAALEAGISMPELVDRLIGLAMQPA